MASVMASHHRVCHRSLYGDSPAHAAQPSGDEPDDRIRPAGASHHRSIAGLAALLTLPLLLLASESCAPRTCRGVISACPQTGRGPERSSDLRLRDCSG